jgi:hypothetical protein
MQHLPIKIRRIPGGFRLDCGEGVPAKLYVYAESKRANPSGMDEAEAKEFAREVARALTAAWSS